VATPLEDRMSDAIALIYATAPSLDVAERIAASLLDARLIACANILPGMRAHYLWQGQRQVDEEVVLIMKTRSDLAEAAIAAARPLHP
jgi:periplasmic divalent cation tolerance protein